MVGPPKLSLGMGARPEMQQRLVMTPPVAASVDDAIKNAASLRPQPRALDDAVPGLISAYVASEDPRQPYTDNQVVGYLAIQGHDVLRRDVALARSQLGIAPASRRLVH